MKDLCFLFIFHYFSSYSDYYFGSYSSPTPLQCFGLLFPVLSSDFIGFLHSLLQLCLFSASELLFPWCACSAHVRRCVLSPVCALLTLTILFSDLSDLHLPSVFSLSFFCFVGRSQVLPCSEAVFALP